MRSYALLIFALAVLHARAASLPAPTEAEEEQPIKSGALDNVSLDNHSEQDLINQVKEVENNLRNSIPAEDVPVKIIEEQPRIPYTIALTEDSNDYVPDNEDSVIIKRVEIDLKNPGPPQRQEHDSQNPAYFVDKERAVAAVQKSIAESQNIFDHGIQDVSQNFQNFFANKEELSVVQTNIENLKQNVDAQVTKLNDTINSYLIPEAGKLVEDADASHINEVQNSLKTLKVKFDTGIDMLLKGADILSILKEEDDKDIPDKISGKADNENIASSGPGSAPATAPSTSTANPPLFQPVINYVNVFQATIGDLFSNVTNALQNFVNRPQNQNQGSNSSTSTSPSNPGNFWQGLNFLNVLQGLNPNQNPPQNQNQQGTAPAGTQSDDASSTASPNLFTYFQNIINPGQNHQQQQSQNPPSLFPQNTPGLFSQFIPNFLQQRPQQTNQLPNQTTNVVVNKPASDQAVQGTPTPEQGSNSVPAAPTSQAEPAKESQTGNTPVQGGPLQQIVQNNPIVEGITHAVQRIQGLSNPSKPRDALSSPSDESPDTKGHGPSGAAQGDNNISSCSGVDMTSAPVQASVKEEPQTISEVKNESQKPVAELNKTE